MMENGGLLMHPRRADAEANFFAWLQKLATTYLPTLSGECFGVEGLKKKLVKFFVLFYVYRNVLMLGCFLYSFSFLYVCSPHHTIQAFFFFFQAQGGSFALYTLGIFGLDILALTAQQHIDHCNIRTVSLYRLGSGNAARCSALRANSYEALLQAPHSTLPDHHHPHQHQHHLITNNTQQHSATATPADSTSIRLLIRYVTHFGILFTGSSLQLPGKEPQRWCATPMAFALLHLPSSINSVLSLSSVADSGALLSYSVFVMDGDDCHRRVSGLH